MNSLKMVAVGDLVPQDLGCEECECCEHNIFCGASNEGYALIRGSKEDIAKIAQYLFEEGINITKAEDQEDAK